jgi:acid phosphatase (class A)
MRTLRPALLYSTLLVCLALVPATTPKWITPQQFDFKSLIGDPPADTSPEHAQEVGHMLDLQATRTPQDEQRCKQEVKLSLFLFSDVIGNWFNAENVPITQQVMDEARANAGQVTTAAKDLYKRDRPPLANPKIHPCVPLERSYSYPSGHTVSGIVWATLLSEIFPEKREALVARGKQIGEDRVLAGMHYPTDVIAGRKLGEEIARRLLADPAFKVELEKARQECLAAAAPHH